MYAEFLYMEPGTEGTNYCHILKEDLSSYLWLFPCVASTADSAVEALVSWIYHFGTVELFLTDEGTHSKNDLLSNLGEELN